MADIIRCERCGDENPSDARFCIDCGAALAPATTGPTTRLAGVPCPSCRTNNPENARFCVVCGRNLTAAPPQPRPMPAPPTRPVRPAPQSYPRVDVPPAPLQGQPVAPPQPAHAPFTPLAIITVLVGIVMLIGSHRIWPGIVWLIAIPLVFSAANSRRPDKTLQALVWWGGLAFLITTGMWWPGILILIFLSMALDGRGRSGKCRW